MARAIPGPGNIPTPEGTRPPPRRGPGWNPKPYPGDDVIFRSPLTNEQQLQAIKLLVERSQRDIDDLKRELAWATNQGQTGRVTDLNKLIADAEANLKKYTVQQTDLQNKVYEDKGQYEELLKGEGRDAYLALKTVFANFGLESLAGKIYDYVKNGYSSDTISILLQDSDEYKKRFAANDLRRKAGLSVLTPQEYIAAENSYRQIMKQSGLPKGFYDSNDDFTGFLTGDMSPTELQDRVNLATQASVLANSAYKQALQQMGIGQGEIAAYFLDQNKAMPFIQKAAAQAAIGAEALQRGFAFDQRYAEELATSGISREQAAQAYARIGDEFSTMSNLGQIYGGGWTQRQAEEDIFKGGGEASAQKRRISSMERGNFSGSAGTGRSGLGQRGGQR